MPNVVVHGVVKSEVSKVVLSFHSCDLNCEVVFVRSLVMVAMHSITAFHSSDLGSHS